MNSNPVSSYTNPREEQAERKFGPGSDGCRRTAEETRNSFRRGNCRTRWVSRRRENRCSVAVDSGDTRNTHSGAYLKEQAGGQNNEQANDRCQETRYLHGVRTAEQRGGCDHGRK